MKLRFKKTGEIVELEPLEIFNTNGNLNLLKIFVGDWEDVIEFSKEYYIINGLGNVVECNDIVDPDLAKEMKKDSVVIGNYFETKEEAKKAVEKLKAWKRLKDKGFRFTKWTIPDEPKTSHIKLVIGAEMDVPDSPYDLDLLFGGKE